MGIIQLEVNSIYEMEDGSKREVTREHNAEDGHMRVTFRPILSGTKFKDTVSR